MSDLTALTAQSEAVLKGQPADPNLVRTWKIRVADRDFYKLQWAHRIVNTVWWHCGEMNNSNAARRYLVNREMNKSAPKETRIADYLNMKPLSHFDLDHLLKGLTLDAESKALGWHKLPQSTYGTVGKQYGVRTKQFNLLTLKNRGNYSLGWIPFRDGGMSWDGKRLQFNAGDYLKDPETGKTLTDPVTGKRLKDGLSILLLDDNRDMDAIPVDANGALDCAGCFAQDKRGKWFVCLQTRQTANPVKKSGMVIGLDPGLDKVVTADTGFKLSAKDLTRPDLEKQIVELQRGKKGGKKPIQSASQPKPYKGRMTVAIANKKFDALKAGAALPEAKIQPAKTDGKVRGVVTKYGFYKYRNGQSMGESMRKQLKNLYFARTESVKRKHYDAANYLTDLAAIIFIGHYEPPKTNRKVKNADGTRKKKAPGAKQARRVRWCEFKKILADVAEKKGVLVYEVNEAYTTITCSKCGAINEDFKSLHGKARLAVRKWSKADGTQCPHCGAEHDRDVNAAMNIKTLGSRLLTEAMSALKKSKKGLKSAPDVEAGADRRNGSGERSRGHVGPSSARIDKLLRHSTACGRFAGGA